jgi:small subunit ribosomal protein S16
LQRTGKPKQPYFRVVAIQKTHGAHGKPLEILGHYDPRGDSAAKKVTFHKERYDHWVKNGAKPSETVSDLFSSVNKPVAAKTPTRKAA